MNLLAEPQRRNFPSEKEDEPPTSHLCMLLLPKKNQQKTKTPLTSQRWAGCLFLASDPPQPLADRDFGQTNVLHHGPDNGEAARFQSTKRRSDQCAASH